MYCLTTMRQSVTCSKLLRSPTIDICELSGAGRTTPNALDSATKKDSGMLSVWNLALNSGNNTVSVVVGMNTSMSNFSFVLELS